VVEQVRVGVIGVGLMGRLHIAGYERAGAKVVAVADVDAELAQTVGRSCNGEVFTDYEQLLERDDLHAISICTPPAMHRLEAIAAAERGLAVLCEKPLAESSDAAHQLAEAVGAAGVPFMVGFFHRFHEPLILLRQLIAEGRFGHPIVVRSRFSLTADKRPWIRDAAVAGGGTMMNSAVHSLDIIRFLTGAEVTVRGSVLSHGQPAAPLEETAIVLLDGAHGDLAIVEAYGAAPFRTYELWLGGGRGEATVSWDPPGLRVRLTGQDQWEDVPVSASTALERIDRGIAYFCSCVKQSRQVEEATGRDGVAAVELAQSAYRAAAR
jgi:predicted dehydrogenase